MNTLRSFCVASLRVVVILLSFSYYFLFNKKNKMDVVFYGEPILSIKYIVRALASNNVSCLSVVTRIYSINKIDDFDVVNPSLWRLLSILMQSKRVVVYFDSFFRRYGDVVGKLIVTLLKFSGKRIIVMPYGADSLVYSKIPDLVLRHALISSYPENGINQAIIAKRVEYYTKKADFVIGCLGHLTSLNKWDMLPVHYYPVDCDYFASLHEEKYDQFTIVHTPNHRGVKGTHLVIRAVDELKREGYDLRLSLLEGISNDQVLKELKKSHLLIDQVIGGGYALSGMEGMACGLPVIAHLNEDVCDVFRIYSYLDQCPIISSERNVDSIKKSILSVKGNHQKLSERSLHYARKFHSFDACHRLWVEVFDSVDAGVSQNAYYLSRSDEA